MIDED